MEKNMEALPNKQCIRLCQNSNNCSKAKILTLATNTISYFLWSDRLILLLRKYLPNTSGCLVWMLVVISSKIMLHIKKQLAGLTHQITTQALLLEATVTLQHSSYLCAVWCVMSHVTQIIIIKNLTIDYHMIQQGLC